LSAAAYTVVTKITAKANRGSEEAIAEPQAIARGLRVELPHPAAGTVSLVRSPMRFSATPVEHERPPPLLGQHTDEILRGLLGLKDDEVAKLRADGAL